MAKGIKTRRGKSKGKAKAYLYNRGDECSAVTGGWSVMAYRGTYTTNQSVTENVDNIQLACEGTMASTGEVSYTHITPVDLTNFSVLKCIARVQHSNDICTIGVGNSPQTGNTGSTSSYILMVARAETSATTESEISVDISAISGTKYIHMIFSESFPNLLSSGYVYEVWLE